MPSNPDATETYRLIITRRNATEILLSPKGSDWALPRVEIRKFRRVAEELTEEVRKGWEIETWCLLVPSTRAEGTPFVFENRPMKYVIFREQVADRFEIGSQDVAMPTQQNIPFVAKLHGKFGVNVGERNLSGVAFGHGSR